MEDLIANINRYELLANQLEVQAQERENLTLKVNDFAYRFVENLPKAKAYLEKNVDKNALSINDKPKTIDEILSIYHKEVTENGIRAASGGHVGFIPGGGIYTSALADYLAAVTNEYVGVSHASPGGAAIEQAVIDWLKKTFSFPENAVGNLTSGGSIANLIALTAARDQHKIKNETITKSVIYLSKQAHHCIHKSLRVIGLEDIILRYISLDEQYRMDSADLENQIKKDKSEGLNPFLVIATAGTTDVGAVDPLEEIAKIAHQNHLWFHVDAAYGGFFILSSKKEILKGIEMADSLVVDPHKGMFLPFGLGAVLVRNTKSALHSFLYAANYMQDTINDELTKDSTNVSPELTKHFRGLRLWLPLQLHGLAPFVANLEEKLLLTRYFREKLSLLGFNIGPEPDLSVSYFWYPQAENENLFNQTLVNFIHQDGSVFLSSTTLKDKFVIRIAVLSFRTKKSTIDLALTMIAQCLEKTKQQLSLNIN